MAVFFLEALGVNGFPCFLQVLETTHLSWFIGLFLHHLSISLQPLLPSSHLLFLTLILLLPSYKNFCDYSGPTWLIQDKLSISRSLTYLITSTKFHSPCKIKYSQVPGMELCGWMGGCTLSSFQ